MKIDSVQPAGWKSPRGYSNGMVVDGAALLLFVAGQIAWDADQNLVGPGDFVVQFRQALENVVAVVRAAGGEPAHVVELTIYITDKSAYLARQTLVGEAYRAVMGKHFPAMALVQVAGLVVDGALLEIQARAVLP